MPTVSKGGARATARVIFNAPPKGEIELSVYDLTGRRVATIRDLKALSPDDTGFAFEASVPNNLGSGVYMLRAEAPKGSGGNSKIQKVVKFIVVK